MASFKRLTAALVAVSFASLPASVAFAVSPDCAGLQKQVDRGETLTGDALLKYDECFPIETGDAAAGVTNIVPGFLPVVAGGAGGLAAAAAGLGGTNSTGSTTGVNQ